MAAENEIKSTDSDTNLEALQALKSEWKTIILPPSLALAQLKELQQQLIQCRGTRVQLCGSKVERIDTASLQLLLAFFNDSNVTVGWTEPSPPLCISAKLLGLSTYLGLPNFDLSQPSYGA
jgi:ABC-type transporter Mla MlaB component